jgi:hypothetical protein
MSVQRVHDIPADLATGFDGYDYFDLWAATTPEAMSRTPEDWARATMEGSNRAGRFLAWQTVLSLQLGKGQDTIAGWRIIERTDHSIVAEARSWFMTAHAVFHVSPGQVWYGVFVRYDRSIGRLLWGATMAAAHRALAPGFLAAGVHRANRRAAV